MTKPPYRVPSMAEIARLPWNGFRVASTFSGCGGSSLGYRMAGFRVVYANEFIPEARATYLANAAPGCNVDGRDVRTVTPDDLLGMAGVGVGELDLLDGSPPCSSFSTLGKRQAGWGQVKDYSENVRQRTDDLFFEFARLVTGVQPRVFVAENVSGLVKGAAKGYFIEILKALKACGYRVEAKLLDAQWLGVPQARRRLIFMGVRADLAGQPCYPSPLPYQYTVREVLPHIVDVGTAPSHATYIASGRDRASTMVPAVRPAPTITADAGSDKGSGWVRVIHDTGGRGTFMGGGAGDVTDRPAPTVTVGEGAINSRHFQVAGGPQITVDPENGEGLRFRSLGAPASQSGRLVRRFTLAELRRICGFPDDFVLTGNYSQGWERLGRAVPPVMMSHIATAVRDRVLPACVG